MKIVFPIENQAWPQIAHTWEHGGHYIEIHYTIFLSRRVVVREVGSLENLVNWCAGAEPKDAWLLVGLAQKMIDEDLKLPFESRIKPYYNDPEFMKIIQKHNPNPFLFPAINLYKNVIENEKEKTEAR